MNISSTAQWICAGYDKQWKSCLNLPQNFILSTLLNTYFDLTMKAMWQCKQILQSTDNNITYLNNWIIVYINDFVEILHNDTSHKFKLFEVELFVCCYVTVQRNRSQVANSYLYMINTVFSWFLFAYCWTAMYVRFFILTLWMCQSSTFPKFSWIPWWWANNTLNIAI